MPAQTRQENHEPFRCDTYDCEFVPLDNLLSAPLNDPEMGPLCSALIRWASVVYYTKSGEGPLCFTCDTEFGPPCSQKP